MRFSHTCRFLLARSRVCCVQWSRRASETRGCCTRAKRPAVALVAGARLPTVVVTGACAGWPSLLESGSAQLAWSSLGFAVVHPYASPTAQSSLSDFVTKGSAKNHLLPLSMGAQARSCSVPSSAVNVSICSHSQTGTPCHQSELRSIIMGGNLWERACAVALYLR
jgi:hypothetical protein